MIFEWVHLSLVQSFDLALVQRRLNIAVAASLAFRPYWLLGIEEGSEKCQGVKLPSNDTTRLT